MSRVSSENIFNISSQLRELRIIHNVTQETISDKLNIPSNTYRNYENRSLMPPLEKFIEISRFFGISCDYLLLWDKCVYPRNLLFLSLIQKLDRLETDKQAKIENSIKPFIDESDTGNRFIPKIDETELTLTNKVAKNISLLIESKNTKKKEISEYLGVSSGLVSQYESGISTPSYGNLVKLASFFGLSIHALITGEKLIFDLTNKNLKEYALKADQIMDLKDIEFFIRQIEAVLKK